MGKTHWFIRALSLTLAICLLLGTVPTGIFTLPVFAAGTESTVDTTADNVKKVYSYAKSLLSGSYANAGKTSGGSAADPIFTWDSEGKADAWRYYNGVMLDAFIQLGVSTGDTAQYNNALTFLDSFMDANVEENGTVTKYTYHEVDSVPPALGLFYLIGSAAHQDKYEAAAHFVYNELEKQYTYSACGGNYLHKQSGYNTGTGRDGWETWNIGLDGLYMAEPFLMAYANALENGSITNNSVSASEIYKEVYERFLWVADHMYDEETGLYHHGWSVNGGTHKESGGTYNVSANSGNGHFWGRGIGWYAVGLVEVLDRMPNATYKANLSKALEKLFDGMLKYQDSETGMWYNVVNRDDSLSNNRLETSVTSLMAYALLKAYNEGWVKKNDYAVAGLNAFNGLVSNKYKDGKFTDIYLKSGVGMTDEYYCGTYAVDEAKGVGAILMAAAQANETAAKLHNASSVAAEQVTIGMVVTPQPMVIAQGCPLDTSGITATVVTNQGTVKTVPGSALSYEYTNTTSADQENITVTAYYNGVAIDKFPAKVVNTANTEVGSFVITPVLPSNGVMQASAEITIETSEDATYTCELDNKNYIYSPEASKITVEAIDTEDGQLSWKTAEPFSYVDGEKTIEISGPLKVEDATVITVDTASAGAGTITLVFHEDNVGKTVYLDGAAYLIGSDGTIIIENVSADTHKITKNPNEKEVWLGYVKYNTYACEGGTYDVTLTGNSTGEALYIGGEAILTATLSAALNGAAAEVKGDVVWDSSDSAVATVENGTVKALKAGSTTITATVSQVTIGTETKSVDLRISVPVEVYADSEAEVTVTASPAIVTEAWQGDPNWGWVGLSVNIGESSDSNNFTPTFSYNVSDNGVVTTKNGNGWGTTVEADTTKPGVYTAYATLNSVVYSGNTYVLDTPITVGIPVVISGQEYVNYAVASLDLEAQSIQVDDKTKVTAVITDGTQAVSSGYTLDWSVTSGAENVEISKNDDGTVTVTGKKTGTATITATVTGGTTAAYALDNTASVTVEVTEAATNWVDASKDFITNINKPGEGISSGYEITTEIQTWTFTSVTDEDAKFIYDTPIAFIQSTATDNSPSWSGDADLAMRSDPHAWSSTGNAYTQYSTTGSANETWLAANKAGVTVTVTAQLVDDKIVAAISNNGVTSVYIMNNPTENGETPYVFFTGEECVLNNLQITEDHLDIAAAVASITGITGNLGEYVLNTTGIIPGEKYVIAAKNSDGTYTVLGQDHYPAGDAQDYYYALVPGTSQDSGNTLLVNWETGESYEMTFDADAGVVFSGETTQVTIGGGNMRLPLQNGWSNLVMAHGRTDGNAGSWYILQGLNDQGQRPNISATYTVSATVDENNSSAMQLDPGAYYFTFEVYSNDTTENSVLWYDVVVGDEILIEKAPISIVHDSKYNVFTTHAFAFNNASQVSINIYGVPTKGYTINLSNLNLYQLNSGSKAYNQYDIWVKDDVNGTVYYVQGEGNSFAQDPRNTFVAPISLTEGKYHILLRHNDDASEFGSLFYQNGSGWYSIADSTMDSVVEKVTAEGADADDGVLYIYKKQQLSDKVKLLVSPASAELAKAGDTAALKATALVNDQSAESYAVSWVSSDPSVATVDANGTVTAVKPGTVTITATLTQANGKNVFDADGTPGISQSVTVTVDSVYDLNITSPVPEKDKDAAIINLVEKSWMSWEQTKDGESYWGSDVSVVWESSDPSVITMEGAQIIKNGVGTATITGKLYVNGQLKASDSVKVSVLAPSITAADKVLHIGETGKTLDVTVSFNGAAVAADQYTLTYEVIPNSGSSVSVDSTTGVLTTHSVGDALVRVTLSKWGDNTVSGYTDTAVVEVVSETRHEWNTDTVTIFRGEKLDLSGVELTIHWTDGPAEVIKANQMTYTGWNEAYSNTPGTYPIQVTYTVGSTTITETIYVVVEKAVTDIDWEQIQHDAYSRIDTIEPDVPYVIGRVDENGNLTIGNAPGVNTYNGLLPINAKWMEDPNGGENLYYNLGDTVQYWYFDPVDDANGSYHLYYINDEKEHVELWGRGDHLGYRGVDLFDHQNAYHIAFSVTAQNGVFQFSRGIQYRGSYGLFVSHATNSNSFYLYGKNGTITTYVGLYGNKSYTYIAGETTAEKILQQIRKDYSVFEADDVNGTNERHLHWNDSRISLAWKQEDTAVEAVNPDAEGTYSLHVFVDGVDISGDGISVTVSKSVSYWSLSQESITVPLNGEVDIRELIASAYDADGTKLLERQGGEIEFDFAGATLNGKIAAVNTSNAGATYTVPVLHNGDPVYKDVGKTQPLTLSITVSEDPYYGRDIATEYAGYPAEGSVKFDKNVSTEGTYYSQTGVAQLELTAAGVTSSSAVDVILIVDISNSMAWTDQWFIMPSGGDAYPQDFQDYLAAYRQYVSGETAVSKVWEDWTNGVDVTYETQVEENGQTVTKTATAHTGATDYVKIAIDGNGVPNVETKLDQAMESASAFADILLGSNSNNTLSFVTFAGMDHQHNTARNTIDSVHSVFTGVSDAEKAKVSFDGTQFYKLTPNGTSVQYELTLMDADGHVLASGVNRGNTNYDFAFGQAYETVLALKAQIAAQYEAESYEATGRQLHVVFMTDGAPSHYNGNYYGSSSPDYQWGTTTNYTGNGSLTDQIWLEDYISSYNIQATKLMEEGKLDGFHAVGFDMAHGGFVEHVWRKEELLGVISGLLRNRVVDVKDATSGAELIRYYTELAQALTYSGTDAKVTDVIGSNFTLYTGTENTQTSYTNGVQQPPSDMWVKSYRLVTMADVGSTLYLDGINEAVVLTDQNIQQYIGKRVMKTDGDKRVYDCEDLEHIVFTFSQTAQDANGMTTRTLVSYTKTNLKTMETETVAYTAKGDINGYFFDYVIDDDGTETITWKLGDITDREVALSYYVYLKGSMDPDLEREGGTYDTNEVATLEYVDNQGRHASRNYKVPNLPWDEASVTVRFFLVNEKGEYVNFAGTAFDSESLRVFLAEYYVYSGLELSGVDNFTSQQAYADAKVTKYPLYDDAVTMTVYRNPSSGGNAFGNGYTVVDQSGRKDSQSLIKFVDTYGDGSYVKTVIEIPVVLTKDLGESLQRLDPTLVVVDYGKPIDINVISEQEQLYVDGWEAEDIFDKKTYLYRMEIIGFATYSELHDQKDYVMESSISDTLETEYGVYSLVKNRTGVQVRFTPTRFFEEPENVFVGIKFAKYGQDANGNYTVESSDYFCMYKQLSVVPASVMYYETDFADNAFLLHQGNKVQGMSYTAELKYTPAEWYWSDSTVEIKGPGTYSMTWNPGKQIDDCYVFYIEIPGAGDAMRNYTVTSMEVAADEQIWTVDVSKLHYDIDANYRVTVCNSYIIVDDQGNHLNAMSGDPRFSDSLTVTFTLAENGASSAQTIQGEWSKKLDSGEEASAGQSQEKDNNATTWDGIQDQGPRGEGELGTDGKYAYGYDSTYSEDNYLSDGSSWFVNGTSTASQVVAGNPDTYATFTFRGTGFDLISRTGRDQATLRVHIYQGAEISGDPYKIISVIDKGANELYQIPVISVKDMPHGTYTVQIIAYEKYEANNLPEGLQEQLARGDEFYFDAIRIYDPVKPETVITQDENDADITVGQVYSEDGENEPVIIQIGALLMDLKDFEKLGQGAVGTGAVYMDAHTLADGEWVSTDMVQQYQDYGPNNEVYLKPGQGIAFILNISDTIPASLQIGAKSIEGNAPTMKVEVSSVSQNNQILNESLTQVVATSTAMYYKAAYGTGLANLFGDNKQVYVFIWNASADNSILSVTDVKIGYASEAPKAPVSVGSSHQLVEDAAKVMVTGENKLVRIDDAWYYCNGSGAVITDYTGLVITAGAGTWYVKNGKVDFTYNGMYEDTDGTKLYYIRGGMVDETLDGIASRGGKWMYFVDGVVDTTFTGIVSYGSTGQWYVENGIVRMDFSGKVTVNGVEYNIQAGKVVS